MPYKKKSDFHLWDQFRKCFTTSAWAHIWNPFQNNKDMAAGTQFPADTYEWCIKKKQPSSHLLPGYSEDGGAQRGEVIPEHEFAEGPVCLDDENEFPPVGNQSNWPNLRCLEEGEIQADKNISVFRTLCSPPSPLYPCWTRVKSRQGVTSSTVCNPQPSHILWRI